MSVTYGFYNSLNHDRVYDAEAFSSVISAIIEDGVFPAFGENFYVSELDDLYVSVGTGRAWFNNTWTLNDATLDLELDPPGGVARRDVVVLEINKTTSVRANSIKIVKGTNSSTPELIQNNGIYQYPLAYVDLGPTTSIITQAMITNMVGTDDCPYIIVDKYALREVMDKLANYYYSAENRAFRITAGDAHVRMSESESLFSAWFDSEHRITLGGPNNNSEVGTVRAGDSYMTVNDTNGFVELHSGASNAKHRLFICNGSNPSYAQAQMVLRCEDSYVERPSGLQRLNLVAGDGAYISIGSNSGETAGRTYVTAPGGFYINGAPNGVLTFTGTRTTTAGGNTAITFSSKVIILASYCSRPDTVISPYAPNGTGTGGATTWYFNVRAASANNEVIANTEIILTVYYMKV